MLKNSLSQYVERLLASVWKIKIPNIALSMSDAKFILPVQHQDTLPKK